MLELLDDDEPRLSTDHGPLGRLADVIAIARLLTSHRDEVQKAMRADASSAERITEDVDRLLDELERRIQALQHALARTCSREIGVTRKAAKDIEELGRRLRAEGHRGTVRGEET